MFLINASRADVPATKRSKRISPVQMKMAISAVTGMIITLLEQPRKDAIGKFVQKMRLIL
jgi:hypothetical protein